MCIFIFYTQKSWRHVCLMYFPQIVSDGSERHGNYREVWIWPCGRYTTTYKADLTQQQPLQIRPTPLQKHVLVLDWPNNVHTVLLMRKLLRGMSILEILGDPKKYFCDIYFCVYFLYTKTSVYIFFVYIRKSPKKNYESKKHREGVI